MNATDLAHLEATGDAGVLREIANGAHGAEGSPMRSEVEAWLRSKRVVSEAAASSKRDAREEETLAIAREALSIANSQAASAAKAATASFEQARWAKIAAIVATTAALVASKDEIIAMVMSWLR